LQAKIIGQSICFAGISALGKFTQTFLMTPRRTSVI